MMFVTHNNCNVANGIVESVMRLLGADCVGEPFGALQVKNYSSVVSFFFLRPLPVGASSAAGSDSGAGVIFGIVAEPA